MVASDLPKLEILTYLLLWVFGVTSSLYHLYLAGNLFDHSSHGDDFSGNWFGRSKDVSDYEWSCWMPFIFTRLLPWISAHVFVTEFVRWNFLKAVPLSHLLVTSLFILYNFNLLSLSLLTTQVLVYFCILRLHSKLLIWMFGIPFLLLSSFALQELNGILKLSDDLHILLIISGGWLHLRCTSFSLDYLNSAYVSPGISDLVDLFGYSFYLPGFFLGPVILYNDFKTPMRLPFEKWNRKRTLTCLLNLLRYFFWFLVTDISLYFLYAHALQYHMSVVEKLGAWTLNGLGYWLGQFFCNKYIVVYGLMGTIAKAERYPVPPPPKCVARIHLYSDMWRAFDNGYYKFLLRYIYIPLCGHKKTLLHKLVASLMCFAFVFVWHGVHLSVFIWSLLNFLGISLEAICSALGNTQTYKSIQNRWLSSANTRRFHALVASPLFAMSAVSNFYFFGGVKVGSVFMKQFYQGSWTVILTILFFSYCMSQVSIEVKNWEKKKELKKAT